MHGGAGGVGGVAVQVFARRGHHVIATAGPADLDRVRQLGAAEVIDYTAARFEDAAHDLDLVFDTVGGETLARSPATLRPGGTLVSLRAMPAVADARAAGLRVPWFMAMVLPLVGMGARRKARSAGVRLVGQVTTPSGARLEALTALARPRPLETRIDRTFPFAELPAAMDHAASGKARGRVVVTLG